MIKNIDAKARWSVIVILFLIFSTFVSVLYISNYQLPVKASLNPSSGWQYYKQIDITDTGSVSANYQMRITVYAGTGTDNPSSGVIYCNNHCSSFPDDIRFGTTSNPSTATQLSQWIEEYDANSASIWVKLPSDGSNTIYMFYGNSGASQYSDGNSTFILFDDFSGTSINTSKWSTGGSPSVSSGELVVEGGEYVFSIENYTTAVALYSRCKYNGGKMGVSLNYDATDHSYTNLYHWYDLYYSNVKCEREDTYTKEELGTRDTSTYHTFDIQWRSSSEGYFDINNGDNTTSITTNVPQQGTDHLGVLFKSWDVDTLYADFVCVHKSASTPPSWSSFGSEQSVESDQPPSPPSSVSGTPHTTSIDLSWTKGDNATHTYIRYDTKLPHDMDGDTTLLNTITDNTGNLQGCTLNETYLWITAKGSSYPGRINMRWRSNNTLKTYVQMDSSYNCTQIADVDFKDGILYISDATETSPSGLDSEIHVVKVYANNLTYAGEALYDNSVKGYFPEGIEFYNNYWWLSFGNQPTGGNMNGSGHIRRYTESWTFVKDYNLSSHMDYSDGCRVQGINFWEQDGHIYMGLTRHDGAPVDESVIHVFEYHTSNDSFTYVGKVDKTASKEYSQGWDVEYRNGTSVYMVDRDNYHIMHINLTTLFSEDWTRNDGTLVYNNTGTSHSHTGLSENTTYYYAFWSYNDSTKLYSTTYVSKKYTTLSGSYPSINDTALQNSLTSGRITWSGSPGDTVWCNSSGDGYETLNLTIIDGSGSSDTNVTEIRVYIDNLNDSGTDINANNIKLYASVDNTTFHDFGSFPTNGGNITLNATTWTWADDPFPITGDDTIYMRFQLSIPSGQAIDTYWSASATSWKIYIIG